MTDPGLPPWLAAGIDHVWLPYTQMKTAPLPVPVVGTEGARILLADGRALIDGNASWWTAAHGYNHPHIRGAVIDQLQRMPHVMMGGLIHEPVCTLARRLAELLPGDLTRVFFAESGSVSVEVAMKMAIQYWINLGEVTPDAPHKTFLSFARAYHGDTFATMSLCDRDEGMHGAFRGALLPQAQLPLPVCETTKRQFTDFLEASHRTLAAVVLEPLAQGAGGMRFHDAETVRFIRAACDATGTLLIFDEIMTGFGRLGSMFAMEEAGVVPDIVTLSKALTGGTLPLSAAVASSKVAEAFLQDDPAAALMHGPTYMGNPLACAAANASLDLFAREPRLAQARAMEARFAERLAPARGLAGVVDVRAKGAIGVVEVEKLQDLAAMKARFIELGVLIRPFGDIIYLSPPLILAEEEIDRLCEAILTVAQEWSARGKLARV